MKFLLSLFMLISLSGKGQFSKDPRPTPKYGSSWTNEETYRGKPAASINLTGDTLTIGGSTSIKVIKIGSEYYQIVQHPATIEKAPIPWQGIKFTPTGELNRNIQ